MDTEHFEIPEISDTELSDRLTSITPLVRKTVNGHNLLHRIEMPDPRRTAFIWDPQIKERVYTISDYDVPARFDAGKIVYDCPPDTMYCFANIVTYHTFGYHGFFKPTIAEVIAQIPKDLAEKTQAFEVVGPDDADDLNDHQQELNAGYHLAVTKLYRRLEPYDVQEDEHRSIFYRRGNK